jgi:hypothetical protein
LIPGKKLLQTLSPLKYLILMMTDIITFGERVQNMSS